MPASRNIRMKKHIDDLPLDAILKAAKTATQTAAELQESLDIPHFKGKCVLRATQTKIEQTDAAQARQRQQWLTACPERVEKFVEILRSRNIPLDESPANYSLDVWSIFKALVESECTKDKSPVINEKIIFVKKQNKNKLEH